jgi:lipoate-protein ligase A
MNWSLIISGKNNGRYNMDFDLWLAQNYNPDKPILRLYQWKPYCISLGANQSFDDVNLDKINKENIEVVKRPTGGRAILHSEELTYSIIYPLESNSSARELYDQINQALRKGLIEFDPTLSVIELEHNQPDFKEFYKSQLSSVCFAVSAKSELNFDGKKIVGSAQRKIGNVILQHGSILCGDFHKNIVNYLNVDPSRRKEILKEISDSTIDLKTALNYPIDYHKLIKSILKGFEKHFNKKININSNAQKTFENVLENKFLAESI